MGVVSIALLLLRMRAQAKDKEIRLFRSVPGAIVLIVIVALALVGLHAIEAGFWAVAYVRLGALPSPADALLYSVDSMTTRGASGLTLAHKWLMMGAIEAVNGMLLFGISTALLIAVMQRIFTATFRQPSSRRPAGLG
jgi:hypothetical protein